LSLPLAGVGASADTILLHSSPPVKRNLSIALITIVYHFDTM